MWHHQEARHPPRSRSASEERNAGWHRCRSGVDIAELEREALADELNDLHPAPTQDRKKDSPHFLDAFRGLATGAPTEGFASLAAWPSRGGCAAGPGRGSLVGPSLASWCRSPVLAVAALCLAASFVLVILQHAGHRAAGGAAGDGDRALEVPGGAARLGGAGRPRAGGMDFSRSTRLMPHPGAVAGEGAAAVGVAGAEGAPVAGVASVGGGPAVGVAGAGNDAADSMADLAPIAGAAPAAAPTTTPAEPTPAPSAQPTPAPWVLLLSSDLSRSHLGDFSSGIQVGDEASYTTKDYRIGKTGMQLQEEGSLKIRVQTASGSDFEFEGVDSASGFDHTCTECNCDGNSIGGGYYWHGGNGGCYGSNHFGVKLSANVHSSCNDHTATSSWGHFHRYEVNTGMYFFGKECLNENEWQERYYFWYSPPASALPTTPSPPPPSIGDPAEERATMPALGATAAESPTSNECVAAGVNCLTSRCCRAAGERCYEKNGTAAFCKPECRTGPDMTEQEFAIWTCKGLGPRTPGQGANFNWEKMFKPDWADTRCSQAGVDCRETRCCSGEGMQCYAKDDDGSFASCKAECVPGPDPDDASPWTCREIGPRTPGRASM